MTINNIKVKKCKGYELTQIDNIYQNFKSTGK